MADGTGTIEPVVVKPPGTETAPAEAKGDPLTDVLTKQPEQPRQLLAGKYENEDALWKGIDEGRKALGMQPLDRKAVKDVAVAVDHYKSIQNIIAAGVPKAPATTPEQPPAAGTQAGNPAATLKVGGEETPPAPVVDPENVLDLLKAANLDPQAVEKQWNEKKALTDEQFGAIKKVIDPEGKLNSKAVKLLIDQSARGLVAENALNRAKSSAAVSRAEQIAGGKEAFDQLLKDAKGFVPASELDDVNQRLNSAAHIEGVTRQLMMMRKDHVGAGKSLPTTNGAATPPGMGKVSLAEFRKLSAAMKEGDTSARERLIAISNNPDLMADWLPGN